jgi:hypothetical protein
MKIKNIFAVLLILSSLQSQCTRYRLYTAEYEKGKIVPNSISITATETPTYGEYKKRVRDEGKKPFDSFEDSDETPASYITFGLGDAGSIALCEKISSR